jgi:hypothetical protein
MKGVHRGNCSFATVANQAAASGNWVVEALEGEGVSRNFL